MTEITITVEAPPQIEISVDAGVPGPKGEQGPVGDLGFHEGAADPHPQYLTPAEHAVLDHTGLPGVEAGADPEHTHSEYLTPAEHAVTDHTHTHSEYLTPAEHAVTDHTHTHPEHDQAVDPHPQYLNNARGDARYSGTTHDHAGTYDALGAGAVAVADHEADPNPHGQYLTDAEHALVDHTGLPGVGAGGGGATYFGPITDNPDPALYTDWVVTP